MKRNARYKALETVTELCHVNGIDVLLLVAKYTGGPHASYATSGGVTLIHMSYLKNHQILASNDLHEMRELLAALANTTELDVIGKGHEINGTVHSASFGNLNLTHVTYGAVKTSLHDRGVDADVVMLILPTGGSGTVQHQGQEFNISPDVGLMRDIRSPIVARQDQFSCFGLPLPIATLKRHARTLIGEASDWVNFQFDVRLDFSTPGGRHVRDTVHYVANALDGPLRNLDNPFVLDGFKDLLLTNILSLLPNSHSEMLQTQPTSGAVPYYVKRACDYIHGHAHTSITLEDLTRYAGCGYRTLQVAFNDAYGMPPMTYLKSVRLSRAHKDLLMADEGVTVFDVAMKWGFVHMGRFAQMYTKQFGVLPSQTLQSRR